MNVLRSRGLGLSVALTSLAAVGVVLASLGAGCGRPELPIVVQKSRVGLKSDVQPGERLEARRVTERDYAGGKPGFYAFRSKYDFEVFRADLPRTRAAAPKAVSWGDEMVLAGYATDPTMDKLSIDSIVDTGSAGLHVYATQYSSGEGCPTPQEGTAFDWVAIPRSDKPVTIHLDTDQSPPCKTVAPTARPVCRVVGGATWQETLSAPWQSSIECEVQSEPGARPVIDRNWFIGEAAKGSATRLTLSKGATKVTFPLDALGHYAIRLETFDAEGKRAEAVASIDSAPANDDTFVQFGWSRFTSTDDPETFPRLEVRAFEPASPTATKGPAKSTCSKEGQRPSWCEVTTSSVVTVMRTADTPGRYAVTVRYLDDRYKGMPVACVRVFRARALTAEACDDVPRKSGETWEAGVVIANRGMFEGTFEEVGDGGADGGDAGGDAGIRLRGPKGGGVTFSALGEAPPPPPPAPVDAGAKPVTPKPVTPKPVTPKPAASAAPKPAASAPPKPAAPKPDAGAK
ncbi:MAG: hypothetical protein U0235_32025 [Polyangiaceae bacterium]